MVKAPAMKKVRRIPDAIADAGAWVTSVVPAPRAKKRPMAEAPPISPMLRDKPKSPETVPRVASP